MSRAAAATVAAGILALAAITGGPGEPQPQPARGVVDRPATPAPPREPVRRPSAMRPARTALRWQLAAEHGQHRPIPKGTFTEELAAELARRPPARAPDGPPARLVRLRELKHPAGQRQLVATIRRGSRTEYVNVLLDCERHCRVAGLQ